MNVKHLLLICLLLIPVLSCKDVPYFMMNPEERILEAVKRNDASKVRSLLKKNPKLASSCVGYDYPPIAYAVILGNIEIAGLLIDNGANTRLSLHGQTLLNQTIGDAIMSSQTNMPMLKFLVSKGVDIDQKDKAGDTVLHKLLKYKAPSLGDFESLLAAVKDINVKNGDGKTFLHLAAEAGWQEGVKLLIAKGADITIKDNRGLTATDYAAMPKDPDRTNKSIFMEDAKKILGH